MLEKRRNYDIVIIMGGLPGFGEVRRLALCEHRRLKDTQNLICEDRRFQNCLALKTEDLVTESTSQNIEDLNF